MIRLISPLLLSAGLILTACGGGNSPPSAAAGSNQQARVGEEVVLDASGSSDADGNTLTFSWSLTSAPDGSAAALSSPESAEAAIVPDLAGEYEVELVVSDGSAQAGDSVTVAALDNSPPVASAGPDEVVDHSDQVELDGRASSDPDGDSLEFDWEFLDRPSSSTAELNDTSSRTPRFTPDQPGEYRLRLTVSDGIEAASDDVLIRSNRTPLALAGTDQDGLVGDEVLLNGGASSDPDGDALQFAWSIESRPGGSVATLQDANTPSASFVPDVAGGYLLELQVDDGAAQDVDQVNVNVLPASGIVSTTIYVSPFGDDTNSGTEAEPLATFGAALSTAEATPDINRIRLDSGTYNSEPFGYETDSDLQIVGPDSADPPATLAAGDADIVEITGSGYLQFVRVRLQTTATAVDVATNAGVGLIDVECNADICISSGLFFLETGGNVSVTRSTLTAGTTAISASLADSVTVVESTLEGTTGAGILILGSPLSMRDSTVKDSATGVRLIFNETSSGTRIDGGTLTGNDVGLSVEDAKNVKLEGTDILDSGTAGIQVAGGALNLEDVSVERSDEDGLQVSDGTEGAVVTVRNSNITSHLHSGIVIDGASSSLDLGTASVNGNNDVSFNKLYQIHDNRPPDADGIVTLSETTVGNFEPTSKTLSGPTHSDGIKIENANEVTIY